ncbi:MAG: hypothetical protein ACI8WY_003007, partial [Planctomycetota bacterium]
MRSRSAVTWPPPRPGPRRDRAHLLRTPRLFSWTILRHDLGLRMVILMSAQPGHPERRRRISLTSTAGGQKTIGS